MAEKRECDSTPPPGNFPTHSCRYCTSTCHSSQKTEFCICELDDSMYEMKREMKTMCNDLGKLLAKHACDDKQMKEELQGFINCAKADYKAFMQKRRTPSCIVDHFKDRVQSK